MALTPIRRSGATTLYLVAPGDFIGVENAPTGLTDHTGINEALDWTKRLYDTSIVEHYADNMVHKTIRVPRAIVNAYYDGAAYNTMEGSYCQSTAGAVTGGTSAATIAAGGAAGEAVVTLASAMPSNTYFIKDATFGKEVGGSTIWGTRVHVMRVSITSTTVFTVKRWQGADFDTLAATHGDFTIAVYDGG